jgi:hypothetical protein
MRNCLVRFEDDGDGLATLAADMSDPRKEGEIVVCSPLELNYLIGVVFDREVESLLLLGNAIPK